MIENEDFVKCLIGCALVLNWMRGNDLIDFIQRCYSAIEIHNDILYFKAHLPGSLSYLHLRIYYSRHFIEVEMTQEKLTLFIQRSIAKAIQIGFHHEIFEMNAGEYKTFHLSQKVTNEI